MNLPNKLTMLRIFMVPVFLVFIYLDEIPLHYLWAMLVFIAASMTDWFDGKIARSRGLVTTFGKFLDPLADKILVITALAVFVELEDVQMSAIPLVIIIAREFMVSGIRLLSMEAGVVVPAGIWGKLKTAFTMVTIIVILLYLVVLHDFADIITISDEIRGLIHTWLLGGLIWISTILTVISGAVYLKNGWKYVSATK
ncbi:MAG: CDP-diacylglycerol--glycerol-3-phosphate 3-phosphatidyltransferase [Ruminococcus sp.]|nr:CDP-diacylglycerol--glycerol-3-phosphate 3-phosphatidyltransferase [Ruminococcus sp.]